MGDYVNAGIKGGGLLRSERDMEHEIRKVVCPTCGAQPKDACFNTVDAYDKKSDRWTVAHWRRKQVYEEGL